MKITSTRKRKPIADGALSLGWNKGAPDNSENFTLGIWYPSVHGRSEVFTVVLNREEAEKTLQFWSKHLTTNEEVMS